MPNLQPFMDHGQSSGSIFPLSIESRPLRSAVANENPLAPITSVRAASVWRVIRFSLLVLSMLA